MKLVKTAPDEKDIKETASAKDKESSRDKDREKRKDRKDREKDKSRRHEDVKKKVRLIDSLHSDYSVESLAEALITFSFVRMIATGLRHRTNLRPSPRKIEKTGEIKTAIRAEIRTEVVIAVIKIPR